jgi:hypothetical protein
VNEKYFCNFSAVTCGMLGWFQYSCGLRISSPEAVFRLEQFLESLLSRQVGVEESSWRRLVIYWTYELTFSDRGKGKNELNQSPSPVVYSGIYLETLRETLIMMTENQQGFTWNAFRIQQLGHLTNLRVLLTTSVLFCASVGFHEVFADWTRMELP